MERRHHFGSRYHTILEITSLKIPSINPRDFSCRIASELISIYSPFHQKNVMTHISSFVILPAKGGYVCSALLHLHARSDTDEAAWSRNLSRPKDFAYSCLIQRPRKQSQYEIKYTHYPGFTGISLALDYPVILSTRQFADQFRPDSLSI